LPYHEVAPDAGDDAVDLIQRTIDLAKANVENGGRPFACVIARNGEIVAEAVNLVAQTHDPTAHAEIQAIRAASAKLGTEHFTGCEFYILAHPCPMCLAAMYYCSPDRVVFITTREEYGRFYTDDRKYFTLSNFYSEIGKSWNERTLPMAHEPRDEAVEVYRRWKEINH
jgi:tRNA(Arg) A34 adenosine deaminase TadA